MDLTQQDRERLAVVDAEYTVESSGHSTSQPIVHLFCRESDGTKRRVQVEGFRPYFYIAFDEFCERTRDVINDRHVIAVEADLRDFADDEDASATADRLTAEANDTVVYHKPETFDALDGTQLVRVMTIEPAHVGKIRDYYDRTWEADIPFERRFMISSGIDIGCTLPAGADRVRYENWDGHSESSGRITEIRPSDPPDIGPRMLVVDIEVATHGGGIPHECKAPNEVTAITAYDSYTEQYAGWILEPDEWSEGDHDFETAVRDRLDIDLDTMAVHDHEGGMLEEFNQWVIGRDFDLVTGWNSNLFDYPYIINRSYNQSAYAIRDWSEFGNPGAWRDDRDNTQLRLEGVVTLDMLDAYKKTQYRQLDSYSLEDVAQAELGMGKEDIDADLDQAWREHPVDFMTYNVRDVQAVVQIEDSLSLIDLYDNMRQVTGAQYETCNHNGPMLDTLFLRTAYTEQIALTTNTEPDQGDYPGAKVFDPEPGIHENVVYPDLASLYPYIMWTLNISPETMYTSKTNAKADGWDDEDLFTAYIDDREWKVMSSGETVNPAQIDKDTYKGVHDETGSRKKRKSMGFDGIFEPLVEEHPKSKTPIYFVKPDRKEGFIRKTVDMLVDLKYRYKGQDDMYSAVKRVTNSLYGTLGDSESGGVGFRLFDWRLAEAVTNAGRMVIEFTADQYVDLINDYAEEAGYEPETYLVGGDSVPANEPVLIRRDGSIDVVPINDVSVGDEVWSDDGFTRVRNVIKKPNRKDTYTVRTNTGLVHTTEDHGLLTESGDEVRPTDVDIGDKLCHHDIAHAESETTTQNMSTDEAWLLGVFCAEGSAGSYDVSESSYDGQTKNQVKLSNQDTDLLERAQDMFETVYGFETKLYDDTESSNVYNLKPYGNSPGEIANMVERLRRLCYVDGEKKVPSRILNSDDETMRAFLDGYHAGDGHIQDDHYTETEKAYDEMWSKSNVLMQGVVYLLRQTGHDVSLSYRRNHDSEYTRIRCPTFRREPATTCKDVELYQYDGEYVYDLETDNHHFAAGVGNMIVHNTDSVMSSIPQAPDYQTALMWAQRASDAFQPTRDSAGRITEPGLYDEFMQDEFGVIINEDEHKMDVEIESLASALFFQRDWDRDDNVAVKKRYAQHIIWDEDDGWLDTEDPPSGPDDDGYVDAAEDPEDRSDIKYWSDMTYDAYEQQGLDAWGTPESHVGITGFEYVRSDSAVVTRDAQQRVLTDALLADDPEDRINEYVSQLVDDCLDGTRPISHLGRPKGISKELDEYGWKSTEELRADTNYTVTDDDEENGGRYVSTPAPTYRGAKYTDDHFAWEDVGAGSKPMRFYIERVRGDTYPAAYEYDTYPEDDRPDPPEVEEPVDAIAVDKPSKVPDEFIFDRETMINKELEDKLDGILRTIGLDWESAKSAGTQTGLDEWA